jgi:endonuclease/exonuclease/phosphatase (EEP) superfamily protein YafD
MRHSEACLKEFRLSNGSRIPAATGFPDVTFDYLFGKNVRLGEPIITQTNVSDHLPVTCDVEF